MQNAHETITQQIIEAMQHAKKVEMPWISSSGLPVNASTREHYNGINILSLWVANQRKGYTSQKWGTYKQWQSLGCQVKKGEKASLIVFYKPLVINDANDDTEEQKIFPFILKTSSVFNQDQLIEPPKGEEKQNKLTGGTDNIETADNFIANTGAKITIDGDKAYYRPSTDEIVMPDKERFIGTASSSATEGFYSVLLHELTHWTGAKSRCNRELSGRFGTESYAMEELVAELGAAFLCAELGITNSPRQDHADYINSWISILKDNNKAIFFAAAKASEAVTHLKNIQDKISF